jgi:hypothetical protein
MALTKIGTDGVKDDAVTSDKVANAINSAIAANTAKTSLEDESVTLAKLEHGTSSNNGKFLRANNGADPTFETIPPAAITAVGSTGANRIITDDGDGTATAEANLTFDGSKLVVTGDQDVTNINVASDIGHLNDTDTKIVFADNQVMIHTAGSEALDIRPDGAMIFGHNDEISFNSSEAIRLNIPANTDLNNFGQNRDDKGKITIAAGDADNATPDADNTVIQIVPESTRSSVVGSKHGGIGWQHLTPLNWNGYQGSQIWMGSSLHDTSGQERANYQIWMNNQTSQGSQPNNHAFNLSPEGYHSFPKTPVYTFEGVSYSHSTSGYNDIIPTTDRIIRGITSNGASLTVPEDGIYQYTINYLWHPSVNNIHCTQRLLVNGSQRGQVIQDSGSSNNHDGLVFIQIISLSANDVVKFQFSASTGPIYGTQVNGSLIKLA